MAEFIKAYDLVIANEGGYINDPDDPGGETNTGISDMFDGVKDGAIDINGDHIPDALIKDLTDDQKREFYKINFWDKLSGDKINDQIKINSVFDFAVNAGLRTSIKLAQQAAKVKDDGIIGPNTISAINSTDAELFLLRFFKAKTARYVEIVNKRPSSIKYLKGWILRASKLLI